MDVKGYYKILGVPENASPEEIKKKFRSEALRWHPDRWVNGTEEEKKTAEKNFKQLNEAYSVLSDKEKRQAYDMGMADYFNPGGFHGDPFEEFFKNFGGRNRQQRQKPIIKGNPVQVSITLSMVEANTGVKKKIEIPIHKPCAHCNGNGLGKDGKIENCQYCGGSGVYRQTRMEGFMSMVTETTCPYCHGTGSHIVNPCTHCGGTGLEKNQTIEIFELDVPAGLAPGNTITIQGVGDYPPNGNGIRGDCHITVNIEFPEGYTVDYSFGRSVFYKLKVPFYDAILGCEKEVMLPDGTKKKIKLEEGTLNGKDFRFNNAGMKMMNGRVPGDFIVEVEYTAPAKLTDKQKDIIKQFKNTIN